MYGVFLTNTMFLQSLTTGPLTTIEDSLHPTIQNCAAPAVVLSTSASSCVAETVMTLQHLPISEAECMASEENPLVTPAQVLTQAGRPRRNYRVPARFVDTPPEPLAPAVPAEPQAPKAIQRVLLIVRNRLVTTANYFGLYRDYPWCPTYDPSGQLALEDLASSHALPGSDNSSESKEARPLYWPFANITIWRTLSWMNNGATLKSEGEITSFIKNVIQQPEFDARHFDHFDAHRENVRFDKTIAQTDSIRSQFKEESVDILVPSGSASVPPQTFTVPGLLYRNLTATFVEAFQDRLSHMLHYSPFKLFHRNPLTEQVQRVYGELFTSNAFLDEHEKLQKYGKLPLGNTDCKLEKVIAALMISSDGTHLTNFGNAKAWPIYLMLGNLSKYIRSMPKSGAMHHLAYIPSVRLGISSLSIGY